MTRKPMGRMKRAKSTSDDRRTRRHSPMAVAFMAILITWTAASLALTLLLGGA